MTLVLTVTCDDHFDAGLRCRGAFPFHQLVEGADNLTTLREAAVAAGWELAVGGDYCPAHARRRAHRPNCPPGRERERGWSCVCGAPWIPSAAGGAGFCLAPL